VLLWDITDAGHPVLLARPLTGPNNYVYSLAFDSSGRTLAAGSGDGRVWLWSLADRRRPRLLAALAGYGGPVYVVAFDPERGTLAAGGKQATVRLWTIDPEEVAAYVCATSGAPITRSEWTKYVPDVPYRPPC
jgi:WD40 repeat protein